MTKDKKKINNKNDSKVKEEALKKCFFITPIGELKSEAFEKLEGLIENVLNPVLKIKGYELIVAHTIHSLGSINDQIFKNIVESDLVISNLTGLNANVMYETAVAHSFGKPTIMISENGTTLPFDLKVDRTIFFSDNIRSVGVLKNELIDKIEELENDETIDNPIVRVIERSKLNETLNKENLSDNEVIMKEILSLSKKIDNFETKPGLSLNDHDVNLGDTSSDWFYTYEITFEREDHALPLKDFYEDLSRDSEGKIVPISIRIKSPGNHAIILKTKKSYMQTIRYLSKKYHGYSFIPEG